MTKREITARALSLHNEVELLAFAVALSDKRIPLELAAEFAVRDGVYTKEEADALVARAMSRIIPQVEMIRRAKDQHEVAKRVQADLAAQEPPAPEPEGPKIVGANGQRLILPSHH